MTYLLVPYGAAKLNLLSFKNVIFIRNYFKYLEKFFNIFVIEENAWNSKDLEWDVSFQYIHANDLFLKTVSVLLFSK